MKSVDTNILVRLLTGDDPRQTALAKNLLGGLIFVSDGVIMETEWVLRSRYRWDRGRINEAVAQLISLDSVCVSDLEVLLWCLDRHSSGADLADMLHIAASRSASAFVTFEEEMAREAGPHAPIPVELLQ